MITYRNRLLAGLSVALMLAAVPVAGQAQVRTRVHLDEGVPQSVDQMVDVLSRGGVAVVPTAPTGPSPAPAPAAPVGGGWEESTLVMNINFAFGSSGLTPEASSTLNTVARAMNDPRLNGHSFVVEGHTDAVGSRTANYDLSVRRAQSVVSYLVRSGVSPSRLLSVGYGEDRLLPHMHPNDGRNRRVEFGSLRR